MNQPALSFNFMNMRDPKVAHLEYKSYITGLYSFSAFRNTQELFRILSGREMRSCRNFEKSCIFPKIQDF